MGLHQPWTGPPTLSASITWREYTSALVTVTEAGDRCGAAGNHRGLVPLGWGHHPDATARALLAERPRQRPRDGKDHGLLGMEHLAAGRNGAAARHLEIAYRLVARDARRAVGLEETLRLHYKAGVLRLALLGLYARLGRASCAAAIARETQAYL